MDFLTTTLAQIADLFRSMTPSARLMAGLLLAVLVVSLGYMFTHTGTAADQYLLAGEHFSSSEIQAMEAAWGKAGLNDYEVVGTQVRVPSTQRAKYMGALLDGNALPANWNDPLKRALDNGSAFASEGQRQDQLRIGTQETLSLLIQSMKGIEKANVIFNSREEGGLRPRTLLTAVATVKPIGNATLTGEQVQKIRNTVAGAVGMEPTEVVVTDTNGISYYGDVAGSSELIDDPYYKLKTAYEKQLREKVLDALSWIPGVRVQTHFELDKTTTSHEKTRKLDPKTVTVTSKESGITLTRTTKPSRGAPGYQANRPPNQATALTGSGGTASQENEKTTDSESFNMVSGTEIDSVKAGLTPTRASVSVSVPSDYLVYEWRKSNPTPPDAEPKEPDAAALDLVLRNLSTKIKETAGQLVPLVQGASPQDLVTVNSFQSTPINDLPETSIAGETVVWFANSWQTLAVIGLVVFSLFMLRSFVKSVPIVSPSEPALASELEGGSDDAESGADTVRFGGFAENKSVRDELTEMVKKDPDAAAAILRSWISTPA